MASLRMVIGQHWKHCLHEYQEYQELYPLKHSLLLSALKLSLADRGFSGEASRIISASWPSGTDQQYNSALKKWCCWCEQRKELIFFKHMLMR